MAFAKTLSVPTTGGSVSYWRITGTDTAHTNGLIGVWLAPYVTQADREAGRSPVTSMARYFSLNLSDIPGASDLHTVTTPMLYAALKAKIGATAPLANGSPGQPDPLAGATDA